jgi:acyl-homoserine-lactone acylase
MEGQQQVKFLFMNRCFILLLILPFQLCSQPFSSAEVSRWKQQAQRVTIIRDNWGIPHIYGKSDADAVFGLLYAQCEDDFKRVEMNYIEKLGRLAEVDGESSLYDDLLIRLIIDSADAVNDYKKSPAWFKKLLDAYADGINYYLYTHPETKPVLLNRFQPWYPLLWTDGSIGAINTAGVSSREVRNLYTGNDITYTENKESAFITGSNGFAIAPSKTASGNAILYINPHVTFYFRPEVHVVSEEGLNAYGAVTWGQFFVYQGFNEHGGWMHTSSAVDVADLYEEKISKQNNNWTYTYNNAEKPVTIKKVNLRYKNGETIISKTISALYTHHGPVMAKRNGKLISLRSNNRSMDGLIQSWQRTKTKSFAEFKKMMDLKSNTSNNTVYADAEGNIAYWHGNFMPRRDTKYDWSKPVPGDITATEWKGLHTVDETVHSYNPANGWLQNCNSTPFTCAGANSPKKNDYPAYMAPDGELFRGINAVRVLDKVKKFTIDSVIAAGYDTYLAAFEQIIPAAVKALNSLQKNDSLYILLAEPINFLREWDLRCGEASIATTIAIEWGQKLLLSISRAPGADQVERTNEFAASASANDLLRPLADAVRDLTARFGKYNIPWGEINRFQRISGDINQQYNDDLPSLPVSYVSSLWGMLPSYTSRSFPQTKKRYGVNGNSFICAVEFGKKIKAKSLLAGGQSGDPGSKHFADQAEMYTKGKFKEVLFYKEDVQQHAEKTYHPGEQK